MPPLDNFTSTIDNPLRSKNNAVNSVWLSIVSAGFILTLFMAFLCCQDWSDDHCNHDDGDNNELMVPGRTSPPPPR